MSMYTANEHMRVRQQNIINKRWK